MGTFLRFLSGGSSKTQWPPSTVYALTVAIVIAFFFTGHILCFGLDLLPKTHKMHDWYDTEIGKAWQEATVL